MEKLSELLVSKRRIIFVVMMLSAAACFFLMQRVSVNTDMTKYLPDSSPMKHGVDIMAEEFSGLSMPNTVRVMFRDVPEEERGEILQQQKETPHADSVSFIPGDPRYEKGDHILYIMNFSIGFFSPEMQEAETYIRDRFSGVHDMIYCLDKTTQQGIPGWIVALAFSLLFVFLLLFSHSWLEPFLFVFAMGIAILINLGTNIILPYVSETTWSIAAILQLALSIDYSVILLGQYRKETELEPDREKAMKNALAHSFRSITGSAFTTVVGFLVLTFMSFKIGMDMGIVLAKGVFFSMLSTLTLLPFLVLALDGLIRKTEKMVLMPPTKGLARFSGRFRYVIAAAFLVFFAAVFFAKGGTGIAFTLISPNDVDPVFPKENQIVVLYENADEEEAAAIAAELEKDPAVNSVFAWSNTFGKAFTAEELTEFIDSMGMDPGFDLSPELLNVVFQAASGGSGDGRMTIGELMDHITEAASGNSVLSQLLSSVMDGDMRTTLEKAPEMLKEAEGQLKGPEHSIMVLSTSLPAESEETAAFAGKVKDLCGSRFDGAYYLIGNSVMALEMVETFSGEMNLLTVLTAAAIFLVVMVTFRSLAVPAILVLLIQSAVYATMVMINLQGMKIYYIALLVVQSILMGATIDYAIVFTNHYRALRETEDVEHALAGADER